jgi:uncharacterized membrane protein (DUF4010 family)
MNKETRSFIWGMFVLIVCASGLASSLNEAIHKDQLYSISNWLLIIIYAIGVYSGAVRVFNNIN